MFWGVKLKDKINQYTQSPANGTHLGGKEKEMLSSSMSIDGDAEVCP